MNAATSQKWILIKLIIVFTIKIQLLRINTLHLKEITIQVMRQWQIEISQVDNKLWN